MGLIKTTSPIVDIRGSVGGSVFTRDTSGLHIQSQMRRVRKRSLLQNRRRLAFAEAKNAWRSQVDGDQAKLWKLYATRHPGQSRIGETIVYTGYQMFMRFNIYRAYNNVSLILTPPEG